ncbi:HNH endonuclease [Acinetobacter phage vB_AbaM_P1]|nr:HNH endonuclease [Acinetobacter phage vB_AbaM_P1]
MLRESVNASGSIVWKDVKGFEGLYSVSNTGEVKSLSRIAERWQNGILIRQPIKERILKPTINKKLGYKSVALRLEGSTYRLYVHRIVAENFVCGKTDKEYQVCHIDGDKLNNNSDNLRWDTPTGNASDRVEHGTGAVGEDNTQSILTEDQVREIKTRTDLGESCKLIALDYGCNRTTVSAIKHGYNWAYLFKE